MERFKVFLQRIVALMRSQRGRDVAMFLIFVVNSAILWIVLTLNEEEQHDFRMPLTITQVPDSVTLVSKGPEALSVNLRCRGTQLLKMTLGSPEVQVDFRVYRKDGLIRVSNTELKALVRNAAGGSQVNLVYPDTLQLSYTSHAGHKLNVRPDYKVTAAPQSSLVGRPKVVPDTVMFYIANGESVPDNYNRICTEPLRLVGLKQTTTRRVKLVTPPNTRAIPDSVDITFEVEPMIFKSRKVVIEPINVPSNIKLITFPAQIDAFFMVPMSAYASGNTNFRVVADYSTINILSSSNKIKLDLADVSDKLYNVRLSTDSAEYIIERR